MQPSVHVIGAGLSGLAAAVNLSDRAGITVYEATGQAGGRCRSYFDHATNLTIDNGNHLLLSGNHAARSYLRTIGTEDRLIGPAHADFPFVDRASDERWTVRINDGPLPWWIFDKSRRVPGTKISEYVALAKLAFPRGRATVGEVATLSGPLYDRLVQPLLLAALNIDPPKGCARLAAAIIRETLLKGGQACRPLIAREGLSHAFVEPGIAFLSSRGAQVQLNRELREIHFDHDRVSALAFEGAVVEVGARDAVVLAVPPYAASALVPDLQTPSSFHAIVNAHFRIEPPAGFPPIIGVLNATTEWIFGFPGRLSVTISGADRLLQTPREELARTIWGEVASVAGLSADLPPWQIVRERRATFAATPENDAKRPGTKTRWSNLFLAGDWTATGLPATIEGAIRSGQRAADLVMQRN
jgi:squalene-associated FAD-dependent desaturase